MERSFFDVRVDGRTVRCAAAGAPDAPQVLVLIHAFPLGVAMWEPQLSGLSDALASAGAGAAGWRLLAPALPGFDGADRAAEPSVAAYARQVLGVLDAQGVERGACCGLSLGGYVAFELLRQDPQRVTRLILADTRSTPDDEEAADARRRMRALVAERGPSAVADQMVPKLLGATTQRTSPGLVARVRALIERQTSEAIDDAIQAMMARRDSTPLLRALRIPVLVVVGEEDGMTPPAEAERMRKEASGARLERIPGAGHLSSLENPVAFNAALRSFLQAG